MTAVPLRIGIVGLGNMGTRHTKTWRLLKDAEVVAVCDPFPTQIEKWRAMTGDSPVATYTSFDEMLGQERLDIAVIATHAELHYTQTMACLRAGVHVFCEKPPAEHLEEADDMVRTADAQNLRLGINHIKRGSLGTSRILDLIAQGVIGEPYLVRGEGKGRRWAGSELMEMGTHLFDWLRALFGNVSWLFANVVHESRTAGASDILDSHELPYADRNVGLVLGQRAFCSLGLENGIHADVGFLMQPDGDDIGYGFDIVGTEGTIAARRGLGTRIFVQNGPHRGPLTGAGWEEIVVDEWDGYPGDDPHEIEGRMACQYRIANDFVAAVREGRDPMASGRDGRDALELVMAVWESARQRQPVSLPLVQREHPLHRWQRDGHP